jgi:hypothetical protein
VKASQTMSQIFNARRRIDSAVLTFGSIAPLDHEELNEREHQHQAQRPEKNHELVRWMNESDIFSSPVILQIQDDQLPQSSYLRLPWFVSWDLNE